MNTDEIFSTAELSMFIGGKTTGTIAAWAIVINDEDHDLHEFSGCVRSDASEIPIVVQGFNRFCESLIHTVQTLHVYACDPTMLSLLPDSIEGHTAQVLIYPEADMPDWVCDQIEALLDNQLAKGAYNG